MREEEHKKSFQVPSDLSEVQKASAKALAFLRPLELSQALLFDIRLCLEEALINAIKYGNKEDRQKPVKLEIEFSERDIRIAIEDEGEGFDPKKLVDCTESDNLLRTRGRGVYLIHQLMDKVQYNQRGNRLLMVKSLKRPQAKAMGERA